MSELSSNSCLVEWYPANISSLKTPILENNLTQIDSSTNDLSSSNENLNVEPISAQSAPKPDSLEYILQLQLVRRDSDYKEVYKGALCSYRLKDLEPNTEYNVRVCAVRISTDSSVQRICSPFTSHTVFTTQKANQNKLNSQTKTNLVDSTSSNTTSISKTSSSNDTFLNRFLWPSFFNNINTAKTLKISSDSNLNAPKQNGISSSMKNNKSTSHSTKSINNSSKTRPTATISSPVTNVAVSSTSPSSSSSMNKTSERNTSRITDQQWAFILILILVAIAILIAFVANSLYTSYSELSIEEPATPEL